MPISTNGRIEARRAFQRLPEEVRAAIVDVHTKSAFAIAQAARARVRRRTGFLMRSIDYKVSERTGAAFVGIQKPGAHYGHIVEFKQNQPFMLPSVHEEEGRIEARFIERGRQIERNLATIGARFT